MNLESLWHCRVVGYFGFLQNKEELEAAIPEGVISIVGVEDLKREEQYQSTSWTQIRCKDIPTTSDPYI